MANPYADRYNEIKKQLTIKYGTTPLIGRGKGFNFAQYKKQNRVYDSEKKIYVDRRNPDKEWTDKYNNTLKIEYNNAARVLKKSFKQSLWINRSGDRRAINQAENLLKRTKSNKPILTNLFGGKTLQGESLAIVKYNEKVAAAEANLNKVKLGIETKAFTPSKDEAALLPKPSPAEVVDQQQDAKLDQTGTTLGGRFTPDSNLSEREKLNRQFGLNVGYVSQGGDKTVNLGDNAVNFNDKPSDNKFNTKTDLKISKDPSEPTYTSDVHTIDPKTNQPLGVMSRNARKKWDAENQTHLQEWAKNNPGKLRVYKNKGGMMGAFEYTGAG